MVRVKPVGCCSIGVFAEPHPGSGVAMVGDSFASRGGEGFFGFGGRHNSLDQHGNTLSSFVDEENLDGLTGLGVGGDGRSLYPNGPPAAYYPQPSFISSRRYGFLVDQPQLARFQLDDQRPNAWNVTASAPELRYVVAPGPGPRAIRSLTEITGRQQVPPRWGLGPMLDRLVKNFGETEADYQGNVQSDLDNIGRYRLPLKAYRIEGWGFPGGNDGFFLHSYTSPSEQAQVIRTLRVSGNSPARLPASVDGSGLGRRRQRLGRHATRWQPVLHDGDQRPADRAARLHESGRGPLLAAGGRQGVQSRGRRVHAGLRGGGSLRDAVPQRRSPA